MSTRSMGIGLRGRTGPIGPQGVAGLAGPSGAAGTTGGIGPTGPAGLAGPSGATLIGSVTLTENILIALSAGLRTVTVPLAGALTTDNILIFPTAPASFPSGYAIHTAYVASAGTLKVVLSVPVLAIGASYSIPCKVYAFAR